MPKIVFSIKEDLTIHTDATGFKGEVCLKETERLLKGLEAQVKERNLKGEYREKVRSFDYVRCGEE